MISVVNNDVTAYGDHSFQVLQLGMILQHYFDKAPEVLEEVIDKLDKDPDYDFFGEFWELDFWEEKRKEGKE